MAEAYPYPPAEHLDPPQDVLEALRDELAGYGRQPSPLSALEDLHHIYKATPFGADLGRAATFMRVAALLQTMDSDDSLDTELDTEAEAGTFMRETAGLNRDFYLGSLLAMHVNYRTLPSIVRLTLLRKEIFPKSAPSDYHLDPKDPLLREVSASMEDFRHNQWMTMAEELLDDEHMDRLLGAPEALYPDEQSAGTQMVDGRPLDFMAGYTFGSCNVMMAIHSGIGKTSISLSHYLPHITPV